MRLMIAAIILVWAFVAAGSYAGKLTAARVDVVIGGVR